MNISEINEFIDLITSKEKAGYTTYDERSMALYRASKFIFAKYKKIYATSIEAKEALAPFRGKYTYTTDGTGLVTIPDGENMAHLLSMDVAVSDSNATAYGYSSTRRWPVFFPVEDEMPDRKNSQRNRPKAEAPIADIEGINKYKLTPAQVHTGEITFLKHPVKPVFSYTQVGRTITYVSGSSVQLEWTDEYLNEVIFLALKYLGFNLDSEKLMKYTDEFSAINV